MEKFALDLEEEFATPVEKFQKTITDVQARFADAVNELGNVDDALLGRITNGLKRKAGGAIQDLLKEFGAGTSFQAPKAELGSREAAEAILRNRFGDQGKDIQVRIKQALDVANNLQAENNRMQNKLIEAFKQNQPGVLFFK